MNCRITDLRCKDVINIKDGACYGPVCDVEVDTVTARLVSLIIFGRPRFFGLLGREEDIVICWEDIEIIGEDTILVCFKNPCPSHKARRKGGVFGSLFGRD